MKLYHIECKVLVCKCGRIPPCYGGKKFRIHEELEGVKPCSEETAQGIIEALRKLENVSELEEASNRLAEHIFEDILKSIKSNDMEEKKTKKMTKVEAYVYLNETKVYVNGKGDEILEVLSKVGFEPTFPQSDVNAFPFMLISDKQVTYYGHMKQYLGLPQKEISVDDILSIEIVEEKKDDERKGEILDEIAKLGERISDLIEEYGGDVIVEIDLFDVILRNSGDILYRKR